MKIQRIDLLKEENIISHVKFPYVFLDTAAFLHVTQYVSQVFNPFFFGESQSSMNF